MLGATLGGRVQGDRARVLREHYVTPQSVSKMVIKQYTGWWDDVPSHWTPIPTTPWRSSSRSTSTTRARGER